MSNQQCGWYGDNDKQALITEGIYQIAATVGALQFGIQRWANENAETLSTFARAFEHIDTGMKRWAMKNPELIAALSRPLPALVVGLPPRR